MKTLKNSLLIFLSVIFFGCTPRVYQTLYVADKRLIVNPNENEITKGNITVTINQLEDKEYDKQMYTQKTKVFYKLLSDQIYEKELDITFGLYEKLSCYEVTITNNTNHILRMKDSRIIFVEDSKDEAVFAFAKNKMLESSSNLACLSSTNAIVNKSYYVPDSKKTEVKNNLNESLKNVIKNVPFLTGEEKEVIPGMKLKGYIIFNVNPEVVKTGIVSFIDIVTEVDQAGIPQKRERFDFNVNTKVKYLKSTYNNENRKYNPWVEIDEEEYRLKKP